MSKQIADVSHPPLTLLSEDERLFRDSVYAFADREVRPLIREMDEQARIPHDLIRKLFDLGVMAIEIPEVYGGAGATFFHSILAVEALSRVDPSVGVFVDVQNTLMINALRWTLGIAAYEIKTANVTLYLIECSRCGRRLDYHSRLLAVEVLRRHAAFCERPTSR